MHTIERDISNYETPPPASSTLIPSRTPTTTTIPQTINKSGVSPKTTPLNASP